MALGVQCYSCLLSETPRELGVTLCPPDCLLPVAAGVDFKPAAAPAILATIASGSADSRGSQGLPAPLAPPNRRTPDCRRTLQHRPRNRPLPPPISDQGSRARSVPTPAAYAALPAQ